MYPFRGCSDDRRAVTTRPKNISSLPEFPIQFKNSPEQVKIPVQETGYRT